MHTYMRKGQMTISVFPMSTYADETFIHIAAAALQALSAYQQAEKLSPGSREIEEKVKALKWQLRKQDNGKQRPPQEVQTGSLCLSRGNCPHGKAALTVFARVGAGSRCQDWFISQSPC